MRIFAAAREGQKCALSGRKVLLHPFCFGATLIESGEREDESSAESGWGGLGNKLVDPFAMHRERASE